MPARITSLPIDAHRDQIVAKLRAGQGLVLIAPPGSGKTTRVPGMVTEAVGNDSQVVVLQPRRLATRLVAQRVATERRERVGQSVGYMTRHDRAVGPNAKLVFMTEGLLLRRLLSEPTLPNVAAVVLDEFHERSLSADLALGLLRRLQRGDRNDLRLVVMSATLDAKPVADYLDCPTVEAPGRSYPVDITHIDQRVERRVWDVAAQQVAQTLSTTDEGHILVFMPGVFEISRTIAACRQVIDHAASHVKLLPLHGSLRPQEQDAAVAPSDDSRVRKVIVSTNVAETSITIDGVRHVVDSGLAKSPRYDVQRGLNVLLAEPISQASAEQRAGRAGRTAPGTCVRLWPQVEHKHRPAQLAPEVQRIDLCEAALQVQALTGQPIDAFDWLDPPAQDAVSHAHNVLQQLGALNGDLKLTDLGRRMARYPLHPRLSRMLVEARRRGCDDRACKWVALISDRPILIGPPKPQLIEQVGGEPMSDLIVAERAFDLAHAVRFDRAACEAIGVHAQAAREVRQAVEQLRSIQKSVDHDSPAATRKTSDETERDLIAALLASFPDHIAVRRSAERPNCDMPGRRRVVIDKRSAVQRPGVLVALDVREVGHGDNVRTSLSMVSLVEPDLLGEVFPDQLATRSQAVWNDDTASVEQAEQRVFNDLVIDETRRNAAEDVDLDAAADLLVEHLWQNELRPLKRWDKSVTQWIDRARCVAAWRPKRGLIAYDDDELRLVLHELVRGATRLNQVRDRDCLTPVMNALSWDDQRFVEQMSPTAVSLPAGSRMRLTYQSSPEPSVRGAATIQQLYGLTDTPTVAGGAQRVLMEILGPHRRPVQVTDDLASFWETTYPELKKDLRRRYPKHEWR